MQQRLLLSLWLSQIAQDYRFSVAAQLLCWKPSYHMQHQILWGWPDHSHVAYCPKPYWTEPNRASYLLVQAWFGFPRYGISEVVFLADDTVFVPRWRVHTRISCNMGDLSMVVSHERGTDITNSILCESPGSRSAPLLYIIANDDKYNYISLCP